jgi:hypothetical protein
MSIASRNGVTWAALSAINGVLKAAINAINEVLVSSGATRTLIASDDFNRANGAIGSNWAQLNAGWGSISINGNAASGAQQDDNTAVARWVGAGTFTDDQYAKGTVSGLGTFGASYFKGVICRASADTDAARDFYCHAIIDDITKQSVLFRVVNGTRTVIVSGNVPWVNGDTIELEAQGTTLRCYRNGAQVLTSQTDANLTSGAPGLYLSGSETMDAWEGGNLS